MTEIDKKKVWVAIPVYNNKDTIKNVTENSIEIWDQVIIVDDGSTDADLEKELQIYPIHFLKHRENQGKGKAILTASRYAEMKGGAYLITLDGDGQHNPKDIISFLPLLNTEENACVLGARNFNVPNVPGSSKFGRKFSNFWVYLETGLTLLDTQSGFRAYPIKYLNKLKWERKAYDFEIEALVRLAWSGIQIKETNITVFYSKERVSHFHVFRDNFKLSILHATLILRRLLPLPQKRFFKKKSEFVLKKEYLNPFRIIQLIITANATPLGLATSAFIGIFLGVLPLIACHTIAIVYIATRLHLNVPVAIAIQNFCAPPLVPALCIYIGYYLRTGKLFKNFTAEAVFSLDRLFEWFIGSLILAPAFGTIAFVIVYILARSLKNNLSIKNCS